MKNFSRVLAVVAIAAATWSGAAAAANVSVGIYAGGPAYYAPPPVVYAPRPYYGPLQVIYADPYWQHTDWRARRDWRERQWHREQWDRYHRGYRDGYR